MTKAKRSWQDRAIEATHNGQSQFGAILLCALDRNEPEQCPRFEGRATVTSDGFAICDFVSRNGEYHMGAFVGAVSDVKANARGLARHLSLNPTETLQLIGTVNAWLGEAIEAKDA